MPSPVMFGPAAPQDIAAVAALFARSRAAALPFLPVLHTPEEDEAFFRGWLDRGQMTLARRDAALLGFMVEAEGWIEHLYLDPGALRQGLGSRFIAAAQRRQPQLSLWCFEQNIAGLAFYHRQGFTPLRRTAGDNEARLPDVLMHWQRG